MVADDKYDFGDGDRDSVLRELIKHDNSHLGPSLVDRQQPTSTVNKAA